MLSSGLTNRSANRRLYRKVSETLLCSYLGRKVVRAGALIAENSGRNRRNLRFLPPYHSVDLQNNFWQSLSMPPQYTGSKRTASLWGYCGISVFRPLLPPSQCCEWSANIPPPREKDSAPDISCIPPLPSPSPACGLWFPRR